MKRVYHYTVGKIRIWFRIWHFVFRVKTFAEPVNKFKANVTATEVRMEKLRNNLEDLRNHSDNAQQMVILFIQMLKREIVYVIIDGSYNRVLICQQWRLIINIIIIVIIILSKINKNVFTASCCFNIELPELGAGSLLQVGQDQLHAGGKRRQQQVGIWPRKRG